MNRKNLETITELLEDYAQYPSRGMLAELRDWVGSKDDLVRVAELRPDLQRAAEKVSGKLFSHPI